MFDFLDLDRYPLDRPETREWRALVERCRQDLDRDGMYNLVGLMDPMVAQASSADLADKFATESFRHARQHNIYFKPSIPGLPEDHPALKRFTTSNDTLCADQVRGTPMDLLYRWPHFARFLAATMDKPALYTMADPLAALNVMSYREGQLLNWHFDRSEFTTTMLLQAPEDGGEFLFRTDLRTDSDPNYQGVARLLQGNDPQVRSLTLTPGTLNVFRGKTPLTWSNPSRAVAVVLSRYSRF